MSLEKLKHEVLSQAERQAQQIMDDAQREHDRIVDEAKAKAKSLIAEKEKLGQSQAKEVGLELRASALLQAKRLESEAKEEVARNVVGQVESDLAEAAHRSDYEKVFDGLAKQAIKALGEKEFVIRSNARDKKLASKHGKVAETIDTKGGLIVAKEDGSIQINNTFEALMEENEDKLKQEVFEELFPQEKHHAKAEAHPAGEEKASKKPATKTPAKAGKKKR